MLRWLYPVVCELCGVESERSLCPACLDTLPRVPRPICLYCGTPLQVIPPDAECCDACRGKARPFLLARSALQRTEQNMELLYRLKYHRHAYLASGLAAALNELWERTPELADFAEAALVPVPMTRRHLRQRGYNQAEELARELSKLRRLPLIHALLRRETQFDSQTGLSARQRARNAVQAYHADPAYTEKKKRLPPHIVLVDDVYTTGSTARACARVLRRLPGVEAVAVLTLVRA